MCGADASNFKILGHRLNRTQGKNPGKVSGISTTIKECVSCGLIFSDPQPVPANLQDHYGIPPAEYWNDDYFKANPESIKAVVEKARNYGGPDGKILDIGIGVGLAMKGMLEAGLNVTGIEPSEPFLNYAVSKIGIPKDRIVQSSIEDAQFPDNYFDYINFGAVLEHLYSPSTAIARALKWVKKGGKIEIEIPNAQWLMSKIFNLYYRLTMQPFVSNISPMHAPFHLYEFTLDSFLRNGKLNNYKLIHHHYFVAPTYLNSLLDKPLQYLMQKTGKGMQLIVVLEKQ